LSPVEKLPVFYVFEKHPLDLDLVGSELKKLVLQDPSRKIIVLYDIEYFYLYG
jgi:diphthamide biosynthesis enzyme Dph1/Dph2-like protein